MSFSCFFSTQRHEDTKEFAGGDGFLGGSWPRPQVNEPSILTDKM